MAAPAAQPASRSPHARNWVLTVWKQKLNEVNSFKMLESGQVREEMSSNDRT